MNYIDALSLNRAKILIVDDSQANILLLKKLLNISNYSNVISTTFSTEALRLCREEEPDLMLLDLRMPGLDGFQVLEQLRQEKIEEFFPVLVITAQNDHENCIKAFNLGAKDFIGKPFDQAEVLMRIRNMLEIRLLHKEMREHNRSLEVNVQECNRELQGAQQELIHRLVRASEFRDYETGNHIVRMSLYSYELGKAAGLNSRETSLLLHASTMHDIGKVGIPDSILLKPMKLNPEEWEIMKTHTTKGAQILSGSGFDMIQMAETIALTHHERWDGTGYPQGLSGKNIPIVGRITAICDTFDALISERPYKKAWPIELALEEIKRRRGTYFEEFLVDKFFEILPVILEIQAKYK